MLDDSAPKKHVLIQPALEIEAIAIGKAAIFNLKSFNKELALLLENHAIGDNGYLSYIKFNADEDGGLSLGSSQLYVYLGDAPDDKPVTLITDSHAEAEEVVKTVKLALKSVNQRLAERIVDLGRFVAVK